MSRPKISNAFEVTKTLGSLYTGGHVEWCDGNIFTISEGGVNIVKDGSVIHRVEEEEDPVQNFTASKSANLVLVTAHKSGLLRQWRIDELAAPDIQKTFRSIHTGLISVLQMHVLEGGGRILGTGGTDGTVKVWDLEHQFYTHNFRTGSGVCSVIHFHPSKLLVVIGFQSGGLFLYDLTNSKQVHQLQGHYSSVTGLQILPGGKELVSAGRDKVVIIWDLESGAKRKTVPVAASVEGLYHLPGTSTTQVILAAEDKLVAWDLDAPKRLQELELGSEISRLARDGELQLHAATQDGNLVAVDPEALKVTNTVVGNNDEILDLAYLGGNREYLVVACNSPALRQYKVPEFSCSLVAGHTDTVLCLSVSQLDKNVLASGSKDREIRIWRLQDDGVLQCLVTGTGHTEAVQGVSFPCQSINQLYSVSKDTTLKAWKIDYDTDTMSSVRTEIAHEKDVNCVCVAPDDQLLATGSQDKTAKLWDRRDLSLVATLRGHKRGIWCAQFSPADRLLATGSADAVIKLWSLAEFTCIKQLEGHDCSVLGLDWMTDNQIVSSATDGLIKVWWVTRQECVATLDKHDDKVWTVKSSKDASGQLTIVSGSADGQLTTWVDVTETEEVKKQEEASKLMLNQQKLSNLMASGQYSSALKLALRLSQPFTALKVLKKLDYDQMQDAVLELDNATLDQLLGYTVKWNTNSRHSEAAQSVLHIVLTNRLPEELLKLSGARDWVEGLLPYTEKHFQRLSRLQMKSKFTTFLVANMKATSLPLDEPSQNEL